MKTETVKIKELANDPANVRQHDERNLDAIKASLQRFGQQKPIVVDSKGIVVAGNGTLLAAKSLGWKDIEIVRTELEGANAIAYAVADNRTSELAVWDDDALARTLEALKNDDSIEQLVTGFTDQEIEELLLELMPEPIRFPDLPERGDRTVTLKLTHDDGEAFDRILAQSNGVEQGGKVMSILKEWEGWQKVVGD